MTPYLPNLEVLRHAVAQSLLHFVWQGFALWMIALCVLYTLRAASPHARYAVHCGLLVLMAACPLFTFCVVSEQPAVVAVASRPATTVPLDTAVNSGPAEAMPRHWISAATTLVSRIERHEHWLVTIWLAGAVVFAARLTLAAIFLAELKRHRRPLPAHLAPLVERMISQLAFRVPPTVFVVDRLSQAMAAGIVRQVVLLPASWLTELPASVLETVIAHELAHLRRWDLAINLLQRIVECALFFHPVVWWCSRRLRIEREICCDALALAVVKNRTSYAKALTFLADRQAAAAEPLVAAGIGGPKMVLLERIRQVLNPVTRKQSRFYGITCAGAGAIAASIVWIAVVAMMRMPAADAPAAPQMTGTGVNSSARAPAVTGVPTEANKTTLPPYTIEPPDILIIEAVRVVPKSPYHLRSADIVRVQRAPPVGETASDKERIDYLISADGKLQLGPHSDDVVQVAGLAEETAYALILDKLKQLEPDAKFTVSLGQTSGMQPIVGEHLVGPDGNVNLGMYGQVYVAGMTLAEAKAAIDKHLAAFLDQPDSSVTVFAYNSKVYYVIVEDVNRGEFVHRMPITGNETVLDAVTQVKGFGDMAKKDIWIARPKPGATNKDVILQVNWRDITFGAATASNYQVLPGDRIFLRSDGYRPSIAPFAEWQLGLDSKVPIGKRKKSATPAATPYAPPTVAPLGSGAGLATPSSSAPQASDRY